MKKLFTVLLMMLMLSISAQADYLGSYNIDDYLTIMSTLHRADTGAATAADGTVDCWIYEDDNVTQIVDEEMAAFDSITGLYVEKVQLTAATGFEAGKTYTVLIQATVNSIAGICKHTFQMTAPCDVTTVLRATPMSLADIEAENVDALESFNLDKWMKVTTAVAAGGDLSAFVHNLSVLGHMLSNANVSDYGSDDDSLVVLSDAIVTLTTGVNMTSISGDSTAADNLELQYDGTGIIGDTFPATQAEIAAVGGGLAIRTTITSVTVVLGSEQDLSNLNTSDGTNYWTGDDDGSGAEFIFLCTPGQADSVPGELIFEGYYDEPAGADNSATLQVYNFNTASWDTEAVLTNASKNEDHEPPLSHANRAPGSDTLEGVAYTIGDVLIKFKQDAQETGNACLKIDYMRIGFIGSLVTATEIVDEWETQSQNDPTGFHINLLEIGGTAQTANDNGADINTIVTAVGNIETDTNELQTDWANGGRLDNLLDAAAVGGINYALDTMVNTVTSTTVFTLAAGVTNNLAYENNIISIQDLTDNHWEVRTITAYVGATRQVTLNLALSFTPVNADVVHIIEGAYVSAGGGGWW